MTLTTTVDKKNISWLVFISIFIVVFAIAIVSTPLISENIRSIFLKIQTDVNKRSAENIANYISNKVEKGQTLSDVLNDVQVLIQNSQLDKGYSCVIDAKTKQYLSHPNLGVIGKNVAIKQANFTSLDQSIVKSPLEVVVGNKNTSEGVLTYPNKNSLQKSDTIQEAIAIYPLEKLNITISSHENIAKLQEELDTLNKNILYIALIIALIIAILSTMSARKVSKRYEDRIVKEQQKNEQLLLNILPKSVIDEINQKGVFAPRKYESVSILFLDIVGFTSLSSKMDPGALVEMLNNVFKEIDILIDVYHVEKIKTIGDAYMVCAGAPIENQDHAESIIKLAQAICKQIKMINANLNLNLDVRIGVHSGEIVAGIIGKTKFAFDMWGNTVNIASRMESSGIPGRIQVSESVYQQLSEKFNFIKRGEIEIKGKGLMTTYLLAGDST